MKGKNRSILAVCAFLMICILAFPVQASAAVRLNKTSATVYTGTTLQLKLNGTSSKPAWKTSNRSVATVSGTGKVKAVKRGTAVISATLKGKTYTCKITVKQRVTKISLNKATYFMMPGKVWSPTVTVAPSSANDKRVQWKSSNTSVARVDANGKVTAVSNGNATITATTRDGSNKKASCKIIVLKRSNGNTGNTATRRTESAAARRYLAILKKYSEQIRNDKKNGISWIYSNTGTSNTWKEAVQKSKKTKTAYSNCALMVRWGLREMGILDRRNFWGEIGGTIHYSGNSREQLLKKCQIIKVYKSPEQLLKEGNLLPGDICSWVEYQHTNVYAGDGLWYDSGRNASVGGQQNGRFVFSSFGPVATINMAENTVGYIIRLK